MWYTILYKTLCLIFQQDTKLQLLVTTSRCLMGSLHFVPRPPAMALAPSPFVFLSDWQWHCVDCHRDVEITLCKLNKHGNHGRKMVMVSIICTSKYSSLSNYLMPMLCGSSVNVPTHLLKVDVVTIFAGWNPTSMPAHPTLRCYPTHPHPLLPVMMSHSYCIICLYCSNWCVHTY